MKRYYEINLDDVKVFEYRDRFVFDMNHSISEFLRHSKEFKLKLTMKYYYKLLQKGIDKILDDYNDEEGYYIFRSKKYDIKIVINWREDYDKKYLGLHGFSPTTLSPDEKYYTKNDTEILIENKQRINEEYNYCDLLKDSKYHVGNIYSYFRNGKIYKNFEVIELDF
jgi:hypothetical protein